MSKPITVSSFITQEVVERQIYSIRKSKVMLDRDLASLYNVPTKALNQAVKRNLRRFPADFMFQLTNKERLELVTNCDRFKNLKHSTSAPYAFTELGVAMLSSVLNSERAIQANIQIMRTFSKLKELLIKHKGLQARLDDLERKYEKHNEQFKTVFDAIRQLMTIPEKPKKQIGFHTTL